MGCQNVLRFSFLTLIAIAMVSLGNRTFGQESSNPVRASFRSEVDDLLTIEKITVLPFTDNLQGIYARPLEAHFIQLVQKMHRWNYIPATPTGPILAPEELEASPEKTIQATQGLGVDAAFAARISKGPKGIIIHLSLFLTKDGKLLSQAVLKDFKQFDIESLTSQIEKLLTEIVARLPYSGRVLSREGQRVTVNLGKKDGLNPNQMLSVVQIIQAQRHPKFNFLIKTEKEIFGKIKLLKVDDTLSFGIVVSEKERGAIQKNSKIGSIDFVTYDANAGLSLIPSPEEELTQRDDSALVFGKDAKPWKPTAPPTFGLVGGQLGLGRFSGNREAVGVGSPEATNNFVPSVNLIGELWLTQEWTFHAKLRQAIIPVDNPVSGSAPTELNQSLSYYEAGIGYSFRFGPYIWSPHLEPYMGYFYYRLFVDDSTPTVFTTIQFTGFKFGVRGSSPIGVRGAYGVGGNFSMAWKPGIKESPHPSGDSSEGSVTQFGIFGFKRIGERLKIQVDLEFEMFSANFSGLGGNHNPATSASHRHTTLLGGVIFMF